MTELLVHDDGAVRVITFNRTRAKNALTRAMRDDFCNLVEVADRDPSVTAVVVTGTDPAFSAGVDFKDVDPNFEPRDRRFTVNPGKALRAMRTPVVCAVNGPCISGALEIALSASFIVASDRAVFADTHAALNVVPSWGLTALLPRVVGLRKAREMSMTSDRLAADEALRLGLVNHVVPHGDLLPFTLELTRRIVATPALTTVLDLYEQGEDLTLDGALALEMTTFAHRPWSSADFSGAGEALVRRGRVDT
jgi:enoyl-CoA hydratase